MKLAIVFSAIALLAASPSPLWLDAPSPSNWNVAGASIPAAPGPTDLELAAGGRCRSTVRPISTPEDRAVVAKGWSPIGPYERYGRTSVLLATSSADGMCRPNGFQGFVFVNDMFAGTLSPDLMNARSDGAISGTTVDVYNERTLVVTFARYSERDALCCPHASTTVSYEVETVDGRSIVRPVSPETHENGR